jgi:GDPmannose 4,6-dehydratase
MRRALITGITGQDGSYLAELLLEKGYEVHGIIRRASLFNTDRIDHLYQDPHEPEARLVLHYGDLSDGAVLRRVIERAEPDEVYHLGAQSHVAVSFDEPRYTADVVALGTLRLLEAVRDFSRAAGTRIRFYQAGSSEMFGAAPAPQSETTPFYPRSPYAVSKLAAHWFAVNFREAFDMFCQQRHPVQPRVAAARGVVRESQDLARGRAHRRRNAEDRSTLGNLDARRDWGFAGDYVDAMWRMLQQPGRTTTSWPPGRATQSGRWWTSPSVCWISTGRRT